MFDILFAVSIVGTIAQVFKESRTKEIPADYWANTELYHKDVMNGVSVDQRMKNLENGKYRITEANKHPAPHRNPATGKIVIENCKLYEEDSLKYGAVQTMKWVEQGKYNLNEAELNKEKARIKKEYEDLYNLRRK